MDIETARYITLYFAFLLTEEEASALLHRNSMFTLLRPHDIDSTINYVARIKWLEQKSLLANDHLIPYLLNDGNTDVIIETATLVMERAADKVFLNYCPACQRLARTPKARQCRHCGNSWRNST